MKRSPILLNTEHEPHGDADTGSHAGRGLELVHFGIVEGRTDEDRAKDQHAMLHESEKDTYAYVFRSGSASCMVTKSGHKIEVSIPFEVVCRELAQWNWKQLGNDVVAREESIAAIFRSESGEWKVALEPFMGQVFQYSREDELWGNLDTW
jgi:hypothetical protein